MTVVPEDASVGARAGCYAGCCAGELAGRVAIVTGSGRGIGRAIALAMARAGADVVVHCRASREQAEEVAERIRRTGRRSALVVGDVRRFEDVEGFARAAVDGLGRVDILVNNAGYALGRPFIETSDSEWRDQLDTLAGGYFRCARAVLPDMLRRGSGVILNVASTCGVKGSPGEAAYAAANGAIVALTRSLAAELGPQGIRVNALLVAWASNAFDPGNETHTACLSQFAMRRVTDVEEIARAAVCLCSDAASAITGAVLPVDAGYLCG